MDVEGSPRVAPPRTSSVVAGVVAAGCVVVLAGVLVVIGLVRGDPACTATASGRSVRLDDDAAVRATSVAAAWSRSHRGVAALRSALTAKADVGNLSAADAGVLALALSGRAHGAFTCTAAVPGRAGSDRLDRRGLTPRAEAVFADVRRHFGPQPTGGYAPGGVHEGHMPGSAHYEGRAIDVMFRPIGPANRRRGWQLAYYLVANAERLRVATVIFDDQIWTAARSGEGFRHYRVPVATKGKSRATIAILEHRDHVHVDVGR